MSPAVLRRYRAERLLNREFEGLRERILANVRARLRARGVTLDIADLEECYALAWQGLYTALLEGQELDNPPGWLTLVCFRRAIDLHRAAQSRARQLSDEGGEGAVGHGHCDPDLAGALDDRLRLRHTFEGLRRLSTREQQAASLCYLQGLSRAEAARRMGISEARMRKLMEGRGPGRTGVAHKVDELVSTIRGGGWCEQQSSLMRAFAFGILDPDGERYRLAQLHQRECPACRAHVLSLRGMAAVLPPLALPWAPGAAGLGGALGGAAGGGVAGAAGGGAAGSWLPLGGPLAGKLVAGCLVAAGVGGGCAVLIAESSHTAHPGRRHGVGVDAGRVGAVAATPPTQEARHDSSAGSRAHSSPSARSAAAGRAERELGFERGSTPAPTSSASVGSRATESRSSAAPGADREFGAG